MAVGGPVPAYTLTRPSTLTLTHHEAHAGGSAGMSYVASKSPFPFPPAARGAFSGLSPSDAAVVTVWPEAGSTDGARAERGPSSRGLLARGRRPSLKGKVRLPEVLTRPSHLPPRS